MALSCRWVVLVAVVAVLSLGCGKKGPLRPLGEPIPQAPKQVRLSQQGDHLVLSWNAPKQNEDGSPVQLSGFRIYRLPYAPENECPECRDDDRLWRSVDVDQSLRLIDDRVVSGQGYRYRIEPLTDHGFPGTSALVSRVVVGALPLPLAVTATADHAQVTLSWQAPESAGGELLGYQVFRAMAGEAFTGQPLNTSVLNAPLYEDIGLSNGTTYRYRISAVWKYGEAVAESERTEAVSATPRSAFD